MGNGSVRDGGMVKRPMFRDGHEKESNKIGTSYRIVVFTRSSALTEGQIHSTNPPWSTR